MRTGQSGKFKDLQFYNINPGFENFIVNWRTKPQSSQFHSEAFNPQSVLYPRPQSDYSQTSSFFSFDPSADSELYNQNIESPTRAILDQIEEGQFLNAFKMNRLVGEDFKRLKEDQRGRSFYDWVGEAQLAHRFYQLEYAWLCANEAKDERDKIQLDDHDKNAFDLFYYSLKGRVFLYRGNFAESLEAFKEAKKIFESNPNSDEKELFRIKNNVAKLNYTLKEGDYQVAKDLLKESLQYSMKNNDTDHKALCHLQLTELYLILKDIKQVRDQMKECKITAKKISDRDQRYLFFARILKYQGELSFITGEKEKGISCYEKALLNLKRILPESNILSERYSLELERYREEPGVSNMTLESHEI